MSRAEPAAPIAAPFAAPPAPGEVIEAAPGVLWARFALPFALNHVNIYLIEDGDGFAAIDTGIANDETRAAWEALLEGPLAGSRLTRLIVTHHHPDHVGLAGWLTERFDLPVHMSETEYLTTRFFMSGREAAHGEVYHRFYRQHGMSAEQADLITNRGHSYLDMITGLPAQFYGLEENATLEIGGRRFTILKGGGHASDQAMLYCADEGLFFAADQVLERITPNVSVHAMQPEANPLGHFLRSQARLREAVPGDVLALPGHQMPLRDVHRRIDELIDHHDRRCDFIWETCRAEPLTVAEITPRLFHHRKLDAHQMSFAFSEALAHVNHMIAEGRAAWAEKGAVWRLRSA